MTATGALWHLLGFLAVPSLFAACALALVRLFWKSPLRGAAFWRWALATVGVSIATALIGLILTGRDGAMATYAAMVVAVALVLWWPLRRGP
jgi:hypothetical protein